MNDFIHTLFSLDGRVALVTGASSGIGRRMAITLAKAGADVVLTGRDAERLADALSEITKAGGCATIIIADFGDRDQVGRVAGAAAEPFGAPDILINGAGTNPRQSPDTVGWDAWNATLHLNLSVPFFLAQALVPGMRAKKGGNIINIASMQSFRAFPDGAPYGASKGGIVQVTRAMAEAWSADGIVANAIAPGFFPTELTQAVFDDPERAAHHARMTAVGRNGVLSDLDGATVFLASRAATYITGQVLPVDGGYSAK